MLSDSAVRQQDLDGPNRDPYARGSASPDRSQTDERWKGGAGSDVPGSKAIIDQAAGRVAASSDSPSVFIGSVVACGCKNLRSSWMERLKRPTASAVAETHCPLTAETSLNTPAFVLQCDFFCYVPACLYSSPFASLNLSLFVLFNCNRSDYVQREQTIDSRPQNKTVVGGEPGSPPQFAGTRLPGRLVLGNLGLPTGLPQLSRALCAHQMLRRNASHRTDALTPP